MKKKKSQNQNKLSPQEKKDAQSELVSGSHENIKKLVGGKEVNVYLKVQPQRPKLAPNVMVFQTMAFLCATKLKPISNKVLMYFISQSWFENTVGVDQVTLSEELNVTLRSIQRAIKELEDHGIIVIANNPSDKRRNDYFLNPIVAWKGNSLTRKTAMGKLTEDNVNLDAFGVEPGLHDFRETTEIKAKKEYHSLQMDLWTQIESEQKKLIETREEMQAAIAEKYNIDPEDLKMLKGENKDLPDHLSFQMEEE